MQINFSRSFAVAAVNQDKKQSDAPKKRAERTKAVYVCLFVVVPSFQFDPNVCLWLQDSPSFGMNMFRGLFQSAQVFPYPVSLDDERRETLSMIIGPAEKFFEEVNNAAKYHISFFFFSDFM